MSNDSVVLPEDFNAGNTMIVDQCVPRTILGPGVFNARMELKQSWQDDAAGFARAAMPMGREPTNTYQPQPSSSSSSIAPLPLEDAPPAAAAAAAAAPPLQDITLDKGDDHDDQAQPPAKRQKLPPVPMHADEAQTESNTLEVLSQRLRLAFDSGLLVSASALNPTTVAFVLRSFGTIHLQGASPQWQTKPPIGTIVFAKYVLKRLMTCNAVPVLDQLLPHLQPFSLLKDPTIDGMVLSGRSLQFHAS